MGLTGREAPRVIMICSNYIKAACTYVRVPLSLFQYNWPQATKLA